MNNFHKTSPALFIVYILLLAVTVSCTGKTEYHAPKPQGYFRIDLPEHQYQVWDSVLPFSFVYSKWAECDFEVKGDGKYWVNVAYPTLHATFNMTYFPLNDDLRELAIAEEKMIFFHVDKGKADDIQFYYVSDPEQKVYGRMYDILGKGAATPLQFWVTDSISHYLRASLYFNFPPNNDSLQPVIEYLKDDALELVNTIKWK